MNPSRSGAANGPHAYQRQARDPGGKTERRGKIELVGDDSCHGRTQGLADGRSCREPTKRLQLFVLRINFRQQGLVRDGGRGVSQPTQHQRGHKEHKACRRAERVQARDTYEAAGNRFDTRTHPIRKSSQRKRKEHRNGPGECQQPADGAWRRTEAGKMQNDEGLSSLDGQFDAKAGGIDAQPAKSPNA